MSNRPGNHAVADMSTYLYIFPDERSIQQRTFFVSSVDSLLFILLFRVMIAFSTFLLIPPLSALISFAR
jgi:hypothetical protein